METPARRRSTDRGKRDSLVTQPLIKLSIPPDRPLPGSRAFYLPLNEINMTEREYRQTLLYYRQKRDFALKIRCERVAAKWQRMIERLEREYEETK